MTKLVVTFGFLIAFAAGFVVGMRPRHPDPGPPPRSGRFGGWLAAELKLTPQQQEKLNAIWSQTAFRGRHEREERRRELIHRRDEAIAGLIRPEDQSKYQEIRLQHAEEMEKLDHEWKTAFQDAVEQTKEILTPEQRERYEQLLRRDPPEHGRPDWRRPDRGPGPGWPGAELDRGPHSPDRGPDRNRGFHRERPSDTAPWSK